MQKEGWEFFENIESSDQSVEQKEASLEVNRIFRECFSTPNGKQVLKHLKKITVDRNVLLQYHQEGINTALNMAVREGENSLYKTIIYHTRSNK